MCIRDRDEIKQLLWDMREYEKKSEAKKEKEKGDFYLFYRRMQKAVLSYGRAVISLQDKESDAFLASLYHNQGVALSWFFYWEEAKESFLKALSYKDVKESKTALEFINKMQNKEWKFGKEPALAIEIEKKKKEFIEGLR